MRCCSKIKGFKKAFDNPLQLIVAFYIETSHLFLQIKTNDWFLYEIQHLAEIV